jgi:hypothetical protein
VFEQGAAGPDLDPIRAAVLVLLEFYDALEGGAEPPIDQLDRAVSQLKGLPPVGGQLGQDLQLVANGGAGAGRSEIVAAFERLRYLSQSHGPVGSLPAASPTEAEMARSVLRS